MFQVFAEISKCEGARAESVQQIQLIVLVAAILLLVVVAYLTLVRSPKPILRRIIAMLMLSLVIWVAASFFMTVWLLVTPCSPPDSVVHSVLMFPLDLVSQLWD